jgi:cardiolipin synthase
MDGRRPVKSFLWWVVPQHVLALFMGILTFGFAASILRQRRPTGSAAAWLLLIVLLPYLGIPLYLSFGGRKVRLSALRKAPLSFKVESLRLAFNELRALGSRDAGPTRHTAAASRVDWLADGIVAYGTFLREISAAKRSIRLQTFVLGDDATGRGILDALVARLAEGVEVELLLDDLLVFHAPRAQLERLRAAGGRVVRFMPLLHVPFRGRANLRNHRKLALFDGERAIVGGMNLADEYMGPEPSPRRFRDLSVLVRGESVAALDAIFCADWEFASGQALAPIALGGEPTPGTTAVPSGPDCPTDTIYEALLTAIFRAERRFWLATPYFVPDEGLARALEIAARRGVDVRVLVPERSNHRIADLVAAPSLRELAAAGGKVYRYRPGMLHAKAVLVDDELAIVGSANFDMRSLFLDYEIALFFRSPSEVSELSAWFEATLESCSFGPPRSGSPRAAVEAILRLLSPLV